MPEWAECPAAWAAWEWECNFQSRYLISENRIQNRQEASLTFGRSLLIRSVSMSINVNCFDLVEIKYLDDKNEPKVEFFSGHLDLAKQFIKNSKDKNISILSVIYFIELMISESNSTVSSQPKKRFTEHKFSPEEFLVLSSDWLEETRKNVNKEIDLYMFEKYGVSHQS